jgi:hypothetical protein
MRWSPISALATDSRPHVHRARYSIGMFKPQVTKDSVTEHLFTMRVKTFLRWLLPFGQLQPLAGLVPFLHAGLPEGLMP